MDLKNRLIAFAQTFNDVQVDHPFAKFPEYQVLRHRKSGKWFGLLMTVEKQKLGLEGTGMIEILDVKAAPEMVSIINQSRGYLPAYHMNKNHWLTALLDGSVSEKQLQSLLRDSYERTR
ncbi:MmcQ/YjbR family DNA-binding protein [Enterococcus innesii]|uniref:MmcQ/YjbR family DNA-binding protein n=1 Tax=Enterococcus innesii TaxID=2839759 RepID=A0ABM7XTA8_9ENTE|nr:MULTISPECIES: MmcQ/YjbR family DNA-binding protein [Enterococcus]MBW9322947.1 MmcQ/YjbR family DNA-binding protein [Enterococcus casseliflavus]MBZ3641880.1 MmcQ/YjbR family DNA-binding protein [Enterococcus casseliflavus]MRI71611.1 MmcQ/YjbR family DNA-binding protein [Enterococcus casseliflavus]OOG26677.1 MmcQ family protein [Enterococcus casseliflavus]ROY46503.1 MmcQ/YjbR family DNA-binding protein [Enterococcus casseliflavus]